MMRKMFLLFSFGIACAIVLFESTQVAYSNRVGAIPGVTGSPHDVKTCSNGGIGCHGGTPIPLPNIITSDIPVTGYIPGDTFTITATVSSPNLVRFGFEISPQDSSGNLLGKIIITDPTRMHFSGLGGIYITHSTTGTSAPNHTNVWSFNWVAPDSGTGCVTFYGCFNYANDNNLSTGDTIHSSTMTVCENITGIHDPVIISSLHIYPDPVNDQINLNYYLQKSSQVVINLLDSKGSEAEELFNGWQDGGERKISLNLDRNLPPGIYLLRLNTGENIIVKKVVKL